MIRVNIDRVKVELHDELVAILDYWSKYTLDLENGGFVGRRTFFNEVDPQAIKGGILNARILWSFAAAYGVLGNASYLSIADRAFYYIRDRFVDKEQGGIFWALDHSGNLYDGKKQIYAQAFAIYSLSEYYKVSGNAEALALALELFELIESKSRDRALDGYLEALDRSWNRMEDVRLSDKDRNDTKTMNTHLHILEAYTTLYQVTPQNRKVEEALHYLTNLYIDKFVAESGHLNLFYNDSWELSEDGHSFGHEIESAWLLVEAAEVLGDSRTLARAQDACLLLKAASQEGIYPDGSIVYHHYPLQGHYNEERHWWVQAEGMVGFMQSYELTHDEEDLERSLALWTIIRENFIDRINGEWHAVLDATMNPCSKEDKVGFWKCPYHNTRALIEMARRLDKLAGN